MKKAVYILGVIIAILLLIGFYFKGHHWPGNQYVKAIAAIAGVVFIPLLAIYIYKKDKD